MKKIFVLVAVLILLVACSPKEKPDYEVGKDSESVDDILEPETVETTEVPEPEVEETEVGRSPPAYTPPSERVVQPVEETEAAPRSTTDPQVRDLLKRADEKVKSYSYLYGGPETNFIFKDTYTIKGDKIQIHKYEEDYYVRENEMTHIYLDTALKTAIGCCEVRNRCLTPQADYTKRMYELDFDEVMASVPKTPYQWSKEVKDAKIVGTETFNTRSVTAMAYDQDGSTVHVKIDDTYGLPHQVVITRGEEEVAKYQFNDMTFNSWKDSDFVAPCAGN